MTEVLVHAPTRSLVFRADDPFAIRGMIPQSRTLDYGDYNANIRVKWTSESVRLLRNLGINAPWPANGLYQFPGKYKPMVHQRGMVDFYLQHDRGFNLSEMGVGKTAATLWAADILMNERSVRKALVLAPLSALERTWQQDIFDVLMHRNCAIVHGTRDQRAKALASNVDFYILNHDGISIDVINEAIHARDDIDLVIVDEGSEFRNAGTGKYKALRKMLRKEQRVWWITGTPCPNAPTDAWAQARIINPNGVPQFMGSFRRSTMMQVSQFKWVPRPGSNEIAFKAMQPAVRYLKKDCLDLPPVVTIDKQAQLTKEQRTAYQAMHSFMVADAAEHQITAVNAADQIGKLRQILCGSVKDPETDDYVVLPHEPRLEVLKEVIDGAAAKVIVIVPFKGIIQSLEKELSKDYSVGVLNGDVSINRRNEIITNFKTTPDPHILLCHPKVMAHSLNLTEADVIVFYAPIYSNDQFQQVIERFNRKGQTRKMTIARIAAHPLEWAIYKMVDTRKISQESILALYKIAIA